MKMVVGCVNERDKERGVVNRERERGSWLREMRKMKLSLYVSLVFLRSSSSPPLFFYVNSSPCYFSFSFCSIPVPLFFLVFYVPLSHKNYASLFPLLRNFSSSPSAYEWTMHL